ncbi:AAA family ATPase [bacterium SCSIO 12741]|nr:AAA family ATPase [bacterium SCSIO 12741]
MENAQQLKRMLWPLLKGAPIILLSVLLALVLAFRYVLYTNPTFESTSKIKLDDIGHGFSSASLYEDFDLFSHSNKIAAEVEVLKSPMLVQKALETLDFEVSYFRVGKVRTSELYLHTPFLVEYSGMASEAYDRFFDLYLNQDSTFTLVFAPGGVERRVTGKLNTPVIDPLFQFTVKLNQELFTDKEQIDWADHFRFKIHSKEFISEHLVGDNLDVSAIDKDIAILRVSYRSEVPEKAAAFVNALSESYVRDYVENRTQAAGRTVRFIENQLAKVENELKESESALEKYRLQNNIINTYQENETDLRKIAQLKIQLANLEMNEAALDTLEHYVTKSQRDFTELAPNFEAFNDLLSTELVKELIQLEGEKKELLVVYTPADEKVKLVEDRIRHIENYIVESIRNTRINSGIKRKEIENAILAAEEALLSVPTKEKQLVILERDFKLNQKIYNFLAEKRTEASIAEAANISFHRIIQHGLIPRIPVSPKKNMVVIISVFIALLGSISLIVIHEMLQGKVNSREELEATSATPLCGEIPHLSAKSNGKDEAAWQSLATNLQLLKRVVRGSAVSLVSSHHGEGKTTSVRGLAKAYGLMGWRVIVLDGNLINPDLSAQMQCESHAGLAEILNGSGTLENCLVQNETENWSFLPAGNNRNFPLRLYNQPQLEELINSLKKDFDLVLIDSPDLATSIGALKWMEYSNQSIWVIHAKRSKEKDLMAVDKISEEYGFSNLSILLNGVKGFHLSEVWPFNSLKVLWGYLPSNSRLKLSGDKLIKHLRS